MTNFNEREKGFEARFKHDQELQFKAMARRNKLLGLWAAELLGISEGDAEAYAKEVVKADFLKPGDEDVYEKVMADFEAKGVEMSEHRLRKRMEELLGEARRQIMQEAPKD